MHDDHTPLITPPAPLPEPGFYYHHKHDPAGPENGYAYEVLGTGLHTEVETRPGADDNFMVVYRPLYDWARVYKLGRMFDLRPLEMFLQQVEKPEYKGPRFIPITDEALIARLTVVRDQMYPAGT